MHSRSPQQPLAVSPAHAALMIGVGRTLIYEMLAAGEFKSFTVGRRRLIRVEVLLAWMTQRERDQ